MANKNDNALNKLRLYEKQIFSKAQEQLQNEISGLGKAALMLKDLHEIYEEMSETVAQKDREINQLTEESSQLRMQLAGKEAEVKKCRKRDEYYSKLELDAAELASLISTYRQLKIKQNEEEQNFAREKKEFAENRNLLIQEKEEAAQRAEKEEKEKNAAIRDRDQAIAEMRKLEQKQKKLEKDNRKLNEIISAKVAEIKSMAAKQEEAFEDTAKKCSTVEEELEWMRGYAAALDKKIRCYFGGGDKRDLESHFYDYLDNPAKYEEYKVHFPQFTDSTVSRQTYNEAEQPAAKEGLKEAETGSEKAKKGTEEGNTEAEKRSKGSEEAEENQKEGQVRGQEDIGKIAPNSKVSKDI